MSHLPMRTKLTTPKPKPRSASFLLTPLARLLWTGFVYDGRGWTALFSGEVGPGLVNGELQTEVGRMLEGGWLVGVIVRLNTSLAGIA